MTLLNVLSLTCQNDLYFRQCVFHCKSYFMLLIRAHSAVLISDRIELPVIPIILAAPLIEKIEMPMILAAALGLSHRLVGIPIASNLASRRATRS